jgi:hypothetical protein
MSTESTLNFAQAKQEAVKSSPKAAEDIAPVVSREHPFRVRYHAPDGQFYEASLLSRVMSAEERTQRGRMAGTVAGVSWGQLPIADSTRIFMQATVIQQVRNMPPWLYNEKTGTGWLVEDDLLCTQVFGVCNEHDRRYLRRHSEPGSDGSFWSPVEVDSGFAASDSAEP